VRRFLVVVLVLGLLVVSLAYRELTKPATPPAETIVEVAPGMGTRAIGALLASHGIIHNQYAFDLWHVVHGGTLKAGEYQFVQPATVPAVYDRIVRGDVYTRTVTIPEGFNLFDIAQAVEDAQLGSKEKFLEAAGSDVALIADLDPGAKNLEGYLFPDTYRFPRRITPGQILAAMVRRFRQASASIGLEGDYHRIVTLASLVEKETPVAEDRPMVASVLPGNDLSIRPEAGLSLQHLPPCGFAPRPHLQPGDCFLAGGDASRRQSFSLFCSRSEGRGAFPIRCHIGRT
jgi:UPF0755 protein